MIVPINLYALIKYDLCDGLDHSKEIYLKSMYKLASRYSPNDDYIATLSKLLIESAKQ